MSEGDTWPPDPEITMSRTLIDGETLHLEDHAQTEIYLRGDPIAVKTAEEEGI